MGNFTEFDFPPILGPDGQELSVEESEKALRAKPTFVPFTVDGITYSVACNLDNIDDDVMSEYELFKNERIAVFRQKPAKVANGKVVENAEDGVTGEQLVKSAKMRPRERKIFLNLLFPSDYSVKPVILGSSYPNMPKTTDEMYDWFARGGVAATIITEEVVMKIDPTGPLADAREKAQMQTKLFESLEQTMEQKLQEIQNLDIAKAVAPSKEAVLDETSETESQPSLQIESSSDEASQSEPEPETILSKSSDEQ